MSEFTSEEKDVIWEAFTCYMIKCNGEMQKKRNHGSDYWYHRYVGSRKLIGKLLLEWYKEGKS